MRATGCAPRWRGRRGPGTRTGTSGPRAPASRGRSSASRSRASGCSAARYGPIAAPSRLPVPDSAAATHRTCGNAPSRDWFDGRPKNASFSLLSGTSVVDPSIGDHAQPAAEHPRRPVRSRRPRHLLEQHPHRVRAELPAPARQRGDVRLPPPPALRRHPPSRPGPAARPAGPRRAAGGTGRRPAWPSPARTRSSGPGTATARARSTPSAGPAAAGAAAPASPSPRRPHRPAPAGTPWSAPRSRSGPAATRPATDPQHHHEPQNGYITTSRLKARPLAGSPAPPSRMRGDLSIAAVDKEHCESSRAGFQCRNAHGMFC